MLGEVETSEAGPQRRLSRRTESNAICSQDARWSLQPLVAPFPCGSVKLDGNSMVFLRTMVIVCNGNPIEEMPAGSYLGINIVCLGSGAIEHHGFDQPSGLFDVARRSCSRERRSPPARR
jgi:hypothetical protein